MNFHLAEVLKQAARKIKPQKKKAGLFMKVRDKLTALFLLVCCGYTVRALLWAYSVYPTGFCFLPLLGGSLRTGTGGIWEVRLQTKTNQQQQSHQMSAKNKKRNSLSHSVFQEESFVLSDLKVLIRKFQTIPVNSSNLRKRYQWNKGLRTIRGKIYL